MMESDANCKPVSNRRVRAWAETSINSAGASYGILILADGDAPIRLKERRRDATTPEMRLRGAIRTLDEIHQRYGPCIIDCFSEQYVTKNFALLPVWRSMNWRNRAGLWIKHSRLWRQLEQACARHTLVRLQDLDERGEAKRLARLAELPHSDDAAPPAPQQNHPAV